MRTYLMFLAFAALLYIPPQPAASGAGTEVRAQVSVTQEPMPIERAQELIQRTKDAERRFRDALLDLDTLDIPLSAQELDRELSLIADEGHRLQAALGRGDNELEWLLEIALDDAQRARARMESVEDLASTAHCYLRLLREMRTARHRGHRDRVLALYAEHRSDSLPEQWAQPVRRILVELDALRVEVTMERQAQGRPH